MKKSGGRRYELVNGTGGGAGNQPENFIGGESSGGQPLHPVPGCAIITGGSSSSEGYLLRWLEEFVRRKEGSRVWEGMREEGSEIWGN